MKSDVAKRIESINNGIIPEGYKKTKVGIVPVEWDIVKMKDICEFIRNGYTYTPYNGENAVKVTRIETISDRTINLNNVGYSKNNIDEKYKLKIGDILFSHINSLTHIGKTAYFELDTELYHGMNLLCIRSNSKILSKYLFFWLNSDRANSVFKSYAKKAINQCSISTSEIEKIHFPLPPLPEQQKIAEILGAQDKLIELQERKINQLKTLKKCYLQKMFPKKGCKYPELRFKGFTDAWEQRKLGEVTESIKNGYSYKADGSRDHTYKITRIESISTGVINTDKLGSSDEINESYRLQDGDILFSHINSLQYISNTALYTSNLGEIYHGMNLLNIRAKSNLINSHFLLHLLKIESNRDWFRTVAKPAVNQASISTTEVGAFEFLLPNLKEQQVIADYFDNLDNLITLHQRKLDEEKQKKKALMQLLLTGKVRVI